MIYLKTFGFASQLPKFIILAKKELMISKMW